MPDLEATGALPPDDAPRDLEADLEAEFADHLALVARDEMLRGRSTDEAQAKANERFGDVGRIQKQCRWVHQGDAVMLRTVMIGGLVALALALGYTTWTSRQGQADLRQQLAAVTAKLEAMAETQPPPTTGTISGVAYLGDKSKPAAGVEVQLLKAPPQEIGERGGTSGTPQWLVERHMTTDSKGQFSFDVLPPATYALLTNLQTHDPSEREKTGPALLQTVPRSLSPGEELNLPLDIEFRGGQVQFSLSRSLPAPFKVREETLMLGISGQILQARYLPTASRNVKVEGSAYRGYKTLYGRNIMQVWRMLPGQRMDAGDPQSYTDEREQKRFQEHFSKLLEQGFHAESDPALQPCSLDPFRGCDMETRPWLEGSYIIRLQLFLVDSQGGAYGFDDGFSQGLYGTLRAADINVDFGVQEFSVANGETTTLRIHVPEDVENYKQELIDAIERVMEQLKEGHAQAREARKLRPQKYVPSLGTVFSYRNPGPMNVSQESLEETENARLHLAQVLNRPFEIEVTGPHPPE